jgi:pimeloyl-ACP methyl ester carboxylesterase
MMMHKLTASIFWGAWSHCRAWANSAIAGDTRALLGRWRHNGALVCAVAGAMMVLTCGATAIHAADNDLTGSPAVPVLVVPGILGSLSSCLFVDPASGLPCPANQEFNLAGIGDISLTPVWVLIPGTYTSLVKSLKSSGAQVFPAAYDWRQENQITASTTFMNMVNTAKQQSGSLNVDVVAHSMGGLVTRSYIEQLNKSDVRKFVMLGTPNRGSENAYYIWEGGDLSVFGAQDAKLFVSPLLKDMKVGYGRTSQSDFEFIQEKIPSVRQLLPIDNYLFRQIKQKWTPIDVTST